MRFTKMQGCGNDYIYINCFKEKVENPEKLAIAMSERQPNRKLSSQVKKPRAGADYAFRSCGFPHENV